MYKIKDSIPWMTNDHCIEMPEGADVCRIDEETYWWQFECMPPVMNQYDCFACSEPHSHRLEDGRYAPTFNTYCFEDQENEERQFFFLGDFTLKELQNIRSVIHDRIYEV